MPRTRKINVFINNMYLLDYAILHYILWQNTFVLDFRDFSGPIFCCVAYEAGVKCSCQWYQERSMNAGRLTHIKGRLLKQAGFSSVASLFKTGGGGGCGGGKNSLPEGGGANSFL